MRMTYEQLLREMKRTFFERCGENADSHADIRLRLETVASELYSLYCRGEHLLRQAFPQTATGAPLDFHAALRDIQRKTPAKAYGTLQFYRDEEAQGEITVPCGTVCAAADMPYLQYVTTEIGVMAPGETDVSVAAEAVSTGETYNTAADTVTVMVNPPTAVSGVRNDTAFVCGCDAESDESLRRRILQSYSNVSMAFSRKAMEETICGIEEVLLCRICPDGNSVTVYVRTKSGTVSAALQEEILNRLPVFMMTPYSISTVHAQPKVIDLTVDAEVASLAEAPSEERIRAAVRQVTDSAGIGDYLSLSRIAFAVSALTASDFCEVLSQAAHGGIIRCEMNEYPLLGEVRVLLHE